jgi:hypothetical protein
MNEWNILIGWCGMVAGALLGLTFGLWAESREWAGGYASFRRQAMRLGHIAAFALGMMNVIYGFSIAHLIELPKWLQVTGSIAMIAGGVFMPIVCLLAAWRRPMKYVFPLPATCVLVAVGIQAWGWALMINRGY